MTADTAGDILDVTPGQVIRFHHEGLIRGRLVSRGKHKGGRQYDLNGQDVQRLRAMRVKLGTRNGTGAWRKKVSTPK